MNRKLASGVLLLAVCFGIGWLVPPPAGVGLAGWRLFGVFAATMLGLVLQPIAGGALVLMAVTMAVLVGGLPLEQALAGYADPSVWLVMGAFMISRALIKTGLARRIALIFVRAFGKSSLGVSYALTFSDMVLASAIPSNGARSGGVILPILRSIAELYGSQPGATAPLLGCFLITAVYQGICITSAMFYTGQASNPLAASMATNTFHFPITWASWLVAGSVPGICSLLAVPYVVYRLNPPAIKRTPEAAAYAAGELRIMGRLSRSEWITLGVFVTVCLLWITAKWNHLDITVTALLGSTTLLAIGVIDWEDVKNEKAAWDIFIWYGGVLRMGLALGEVGVTGAFAKSVASNFGTAGWITLFVAALAIYFYTHYGFASITAHLLAMYTPFVAVLVAKGAPLGLMVFTFAIFANLAAGLTHYGTTPSPMYYAADYVPFRTFWGTGLVISFVNLAIFSTVGFAWWKLLGIW